MKNKWLNMALLSSMLLIGPSVLASEVQSQTSDTHESTTNQQEKTDSSTETDEKKNSKDENEGYETVIYQGKKLTLPTGPKDTKSTPKITEDNQGVMGQEARKVSQKAREAVLNFTLGNTSVPNVDFIDISSYQGTMTQKDFNTMKSKGVRGVVVKLTEGTSYRNPYAKQQITMAQKAGMKVSVYHFSHFLNKSQAEAEARYFANYANELGLPKSTIMVNDIEASECNNGYTTSNSVYFALELIRQLGYETVLHYGYQNWFESGVLNANTLGSDSIWIASYPYTPSKSDLWFKNLYEAWQFSSTMKLPAGSDYTGNIDANIDYTGRFTQNVSKAYELTDTYVTINIQNHTVYGDKALSVKKQSTSDIYHKTFKAERYYLINGIKYYSIYDKNDKWQGYVSEEDIKLGANNQNRTGGAFYQQTGRYAIVKKENYTLWRGLDFKEKKGTARLNQQYQVKGLYYHFNGSTYASVYDHSGNWKGYINTSGLTISSSMFGTFKSDPKYVSVAKKGYGIFQDKNFKKKVATSDQKYHKTYKSKGYYDLFDGTRYYTIYREDKDGNLTWEGYIRSSAMKTGIENGSSKAGAFFSVAKEGTIVKSDYPLWNDFDYKEKRGTTNRLINKKVYVHGEYNRVTGQKYYTIYESKDGKWLGYINADAVKI